MEKELTGISPWASSTFSRRPNSFGFFHEPASDIYEFADKFVIEADLPGISKDEITVELVDDRTIAIKGKFKRGDLSKDEGDKSSSSSHYGHHFERMQGEFMRQFELPLKIKGDEIKANLKDGVLRVEIPKIETKEGEVKKIPISE